MVEAQPRAHLAPARGRADGRPGERVVAEAQRSGAWDALREVEALAAPDDLAAALGKQAGTRERWEALPPSLRRGQLERLLDAKRPATRARRVARIVDALARGERPR